MMYTHQYSELDCSASRFQSCLKISLIFRFEKNPSDFKKQHKHMITKICFLYLHLYIPVHVHVYDLLEYIESVSCMCFTHILVEGIKYYAIGDWLPSEKLAGL